MKTVPLSLRALTLGLCAASLPAQDPVLSTPGSATWETIDTDSGSRTTFTIFDDTVFDWGQLNLGEGSEFVFDFIGGESVVNRLGGTGTHFIAGDVVSNGVVGFFAPESNLIVTGDITASGVTLATLGVDPADFSDGGGYRLSGPAGYNMLYIAGRVQATEGDVVLAGRTVNIAGTAQIEAAGAVMIAGGSEVNVAATGARRLTEESGAGFVLHLGETRASRIEVAAGSEIINRGSLGEGKVRVFLEVGEGGSISNEGSGLIVDDAVFDGDFDSDGITIRPHEGDSASVVSEASLKIPVLKRPDGSSVSGSRTVTYSAPMSASGDGSRDAAKPKAKTVARRAASSPLMRKASFFGMRGGDKAKN